MNNTRKSYWEIERIFHCSIAGTCLSLGEARQILTKSGVKIPENAEDYRLHAAVVESGNGKNPVSVNINRVLEKKYRREILHFSGIDSQETLRREWDESVKKGNIPGPYWALMTHPSADTSLLDHAFGVVHMLSHLNGDSRRSELEKQNELMHKLQKERESKNIYRQKTKDLEKRLKEAESRLSVIPGLEKKLEQYDQEKPQNSQIPDPEVDEKIRTAIQTAEKNLKDAIQCREMRIEELMAELHAQKEENKKLNNELDAYRLSITEFIDRKKNECLKCKKKDCQCRHLENKCVLYVGGRTSIIPRCRDIVEQEGGIFIHHDGGMEQNFLRLPEVLKRADLVCCPADCISHNAYSKIKKECRQQRKEFVILKSSGLSSFSEIIHETFMN